MPPGYSRILCIVQAGLKIHGDPSVSIFLLLAYTCLIVNLNLIFFLCISTLQREMKCLCKHRHRVSRIKEIGQRKRKGQTSNGIGQCT